MSVKITDLVDPKALEDLKAINTELQALLTTYTNVAKDLAKGLDINVRVVGDIDKLEKFLAEKSKQATTATEQLNGVIARQGEALANTTNTISRHLMEQERVNKTQRQAYTEYDRVKKLIEQYNDTYSEHSRRLVSLKLQLDSNKDALKNNESLYKSGRITISQYLDTQAQLTEQHRLLMQEKRTLSQLMTKEEKAMQTGEGSYVQLSQQLEMMKNTYKDMADGVRSGDLGKEFENAIQNLDAHLKDMAADMGEFQRNVGNYAIAAKNGVVTSDSLTNVLQQQALTAKDLADQNKILAEARSMLDQSDAGYSDTVAMINAKLAENKARLSDVSDIMGVQASTAAEAEAQNKRLNEALKQVDQGSAGANARIAELNRKIKENDDVISKAKGSRASVRKDLKEMVLEIANLSIEYAKLSEEEQNTADGQALKHHIQALTEEAGVLRDAINDTNEAITNAASDTRGFDQLGGAIQLAIDGFGLAQGAAAMLGISEGELAEIQTKLQAAIAASNAMQSIQAALQKQSALTQAAVTVQTKLRTAAENLHTAAQGKGVIATKAATVAQWAFNKAANANPIILIAGAVIAGTAALWGLCKAYTAIVSPSKEALNNYKQQREALDEMTESNDRLVDRMKARGATEADIQRQSLQNKEAEMYAAKAVFVQASQLYDKDEDEYKDALDAKKKAEEDLKARQEASLNYILSVITDSEREKKKQSLGTYDYKRELIMAELEQQKLVTAELLKQGKIVQEEYERLVASLDAAAQTKISDVNKEEREKAAEDAKKRAEDLKKAVQAGEDALLNIIADSLERQRAAELLSYNRRKKELEERLAKTKANEITMREALNNQLEGLAAEHNRKMADIEFSQLERRNNAETEMIESRLSIVEKGSADELDLRLQALDKQYKAELIKIQKSESDKTITVEEGEEKRLNLVEDYANRREQIIEDHAAKEVEAIQKRYADEQSERDNNMLSELNGLKMKYAEELRAAGNNEKRKAELTELYNRKSADITEKYAIQSAQATVDMLGECLKKEDLSADERERIEKDLAKAKMDLETAIADHMINETQRQVDADSDALEKRKLTARDWLQATSDALNAINDLTSSVYDAKIQKIEENQEINNAAAEDEQNRIQELVDKKAITEEEGEARKRAAEAQTAKKNEELEKKKQQLKQKEAIWDKSNSAAQTTISTALAIMRLWAELGLAALPMQVLVAGIGAMQLATILATPIPKYAKGTDSHKGGPAIVGDGGRPEVIMYNGGAWLTPDTPTLVNMPTGAVVIPSINDIDNNIPVVMLPSGSDGHPAVKPYNDTNIRREIGELGRLIKAQTRQQHIDNYNLNYEIFKKRFL